MRKIFIIIVCSSGIIIDLLRLVNFYFRPRFLSRWKIFAYHIPKNELVFYYGAMMLLLLYVILRQLGYEMI